MWFTSTYMSSAAKHWLFRTAPRTTNVMLASATVSSLSTRWLLKYNQVEKNTSWKPAGPAFLFYQFLYRGRLSHIQWLHFWLTVILVKFSIQMQVSSCTWPRQEIILPRNSNCCWVTRSLTDSAWFFYSLVDAARDHLSTDRLKYQLGRMKQQATYKIPPHSHQWPAFS